MLICVEKTIPTVPEHKEMKEVGIVCDLCGKRSKRPNGWNTMSGEINKVTVEHMQGINTYEGGYEQGAAFDLCPECFKNELVPWIKSKSGASPRTIDLNW